MSLLVGAVPGLAVILALFLAVRGFYLVRVPERANVEIDDLELRTADAVRTTPLSRAGARLVPHFRRALPTTVLRWLQRQVDAAGRPNGLTVDDVLARAGMWLILLLLPILLFLAQGNWIALALCLGVMVVMPLANLTRLARSRRERIDRDLPDFLDVLAVTVTAGLGFRSALAVVSERFGGPIAEEIQTILHQLANGASVRSAFQAFGARTQSESVDEFVTAYLQSEELGAPLADTLNQIAADMRRASSQRMRQKAAKVTPRVTLIVTTALVPGALILLAAGMYIGFGDRFGGLLGG